MKGGAGVTLERIPFVLPKLGLKLDLFLMQPLQLSIIWKNLSLYQKDQRRRSVWVGHADFSKIAQREQNSLNMSTACFFF